MTRLDQLEAAWRRESRAKRILPAWARPTFMDWVRTEIAERDHGKCQWRPRKRSAATLAALREMCARRGHAAEFDRMRQYLEPWPAPIG